MRAAVVGLLLCLVSGCMKFSPSFPLIEMVPIPAGKFIMGSPEGEKWRELFEGQAAVTLTKPFWLGKTEVTQGQWKAVMGTEPWKGELYDRMMHPPWEIPHVVMTQERRQDNPLIGVDFAATYVEFEDATAFCQKLTELARNTGKLKANEEYRLPTEAEWEYACRAGTTTAYSFGDDERQLDDYAWHCVITYALDQQFAHKVGLLRPNPWGLYDMHGNVTEWCVDVYNKRAAAGADPVALPEREDVGQNRVSRGGGWRECAGECRSACRGLGGHWQQQYQGFRVARSFTTMRAFAEQRDRDVAKERAVAEQTERDVAKERAAAIAEVKAGGEYVVFDAQHVMSRYNLDKSKLTKIQVWNFGEIDLVEVDNQQNERSGEVRDGKIIAKNAETEIRKPVKIPHLTPGVFVGFEKSLDWNDGVWIDFGDIQVCFEGSDQMSGREEKTGVRDDGEGREAETLDSYSNSIRVRVRVADKNGGQKWDTWLCRFRDERKTALSDKGSGFLVYKGGIRRDEKKVEELKERRASGRVVE